MAQVKKEMKKCFRTTYLGYEVGVSHLIFENVVTEIHLSGRINEFIENIFLSKKQIIEKKFASKKNLCQIFSHEEKNNPFIVFLQISSSLLCLSSKSLQSFSNFSQ